MVHYTQEEDKYSFALMSLEGLDLMINMKSRISVHAYTAEGVLYFG